MFWILKVKNQTCLYVFYNIWTLFVACCFFIYKNLYDSVNKK